MSAWIYLAPDIDLPQSRVLKALTARAHLAFPGIASSVAEVYDTHHARYVVSVGKAGAEEWHRFGLVQVGVAHGSLFLHRHPTARYPTLTIMQLQHPATAMQMSLDGHNAKEDIGVDLARWRELMECIGSKKFVDLKRRMRMTRCARCAASRNVVHKRAATHWLEGADGIGLCDDHWRKRASIRVKSEKVERNKSRPEAQIAGQGELLDLLQ